MTDRTALPLSSAVECDLIDDDGRPVLVVRVGEAIEVRVSASNSHTETLAGVRRLIDGLWSLHGSVTGMQYRAEMEARRHASEVPLVDAEGIPDGQLGEASRAAARTVERVHGDRAEEPGPMRSPSVRLPRMYPPPGTSGAH